ncbi:MAG: lysophospholipid acyltransferase family protein [Elusimicrobiota bacterium]
MAGQINAETPQQAGRLSRPPWWRRLAPYAAYCYISFVGLTTRLRIEHAEHRENLKRQNRRFIYAFWHQRQVFFTWSHRGEPISILVSRSQDGELIARTMSLFSIHSSRGSSSRGALAGLREMEKILTSGFDIGFTPDGPKGPARQIKPGVLYLAQKLNLPILPIANALSHKLEFKKSWDHFQVPLPFGRAVISYGKPIHVGPSDDLSQKADELKTAMDQITREADEAIGA